MGGGRCDDAGGVDGVRLCVRCRLGAPEGAGSGVARADPGYDGPFPFHVLQALLWVVFGTASESYACVHGYGADGARSRWTCPLVRWLDDGGAGLGVHLGGSDDRHARQRVVPDKTSRIPCRTCPARRARFYSSLLYRPGAVFA